MQYTINVRGRLVDLSQPMVMGILNATPDSLYSGSRKQTEAEIADRANQIISEGGRMIDVGAFSTRPAIVSVDTYRPRVARRCVEEFGADIINDVSEGGITGIVDTPIHEEGDMFQTVAQLQVPYILMSVQPTLETMMKNFADEVQRLRDLGAKDIILDPGYGFGKTLDQNYEILSHAERLSELELPVLVGISRKSMIFKKAGGDPTTSLPGTIALNAVSLMKGASILRVHDVKEAVEAVKITNKMRSC